MLADFDHACGKIGLQLNLTKTMFMRNGFVPDAPFSLNGTNIFECSEEKSVNVEEVWDARSKVTLIHCYRDEPHIWNVNTVYRSDAERRQTLSEAWSRIQQRMSAMGYNFEGKFSPPSLWI
ncbi:unnamed protein product [Nippostrongylus brasiliensis]|uniref:Reverse transcriptase domain-containing protein n=1 Tax=Nippostrongylus brasiliensis TaxID=27835 RepID=A0A0N4YLL2_NIPBR|nr:unnamed protein product [Nippostrongylus brasiliensis]